ncbi:MAG: SurA N-terminal domain-containing protein, partial [Pseudomonadota bacterium]
MLEALRNSTKSWIVKVFLGLIALSFVAWGVGDVVNSGLYGTGAAIEVGDREISAAEVNAEFKREIDRLQPLFGGKLTTEDARKLGLLDRTIEAIVTRTLIDEAGRRLGLAVSEEAVVAEIAADPNFRNELGQFDPDRLRLVLARAGLGEKEYLRIERDNMIRTQMAEALSGGLAAPTALVDPLVRFREERRVAETVTVTDDSIALPAAPD